MLYIVYLVSMVIYLLYGIRWDRLLNFYDPVTLEFLVFPCILILFVTGSFAAFARAFLFAFGKREYGLLQCQESFQSVRMVMHTAFVSGGVCFLIGITNAIRTADLSENISWLLLDLSVASLSLFYALLVFLILLPVCFLLKKHLIRGAADAGGIELMDGEIDDCAVQVYDDTVSSAPDGGVF